MGVIMEIVRNFLGVTRYITQHPLNVGFRFQAVSNFFRWQIGARLLQKKVLIPWVGDSSFITGLGETGLTGNLYAGFMECEDMLFLLHALQPAETFVDVGANIGAYTILASKVVKSRSIAFEPLPKTADRLRDQVHINRIETIVDVRNMGVGDKKGALFFTNNKDATNKVSLAGERANTTRVEVSTLDSELVEGELYFLKIDVEGFEYNVIQGASSLLSTDNISAVIIELNGNSEEFGHSNELIHQQLLSFNLKPVTYNPFSRTLIRLNGYNKNRTNTIYVRDVEKTRALCKSAPKRVIHTARNIEL